MGVHVAHARFATAQPSEDGAAAWRKNGSLEPIAWNGIHHRHSLALSTSTWMREQFNYSGRCGLRPRRPSTVGTVGIVDSSSGTARMRESELPSPCSTRSRYGSMPEFRSRACRSSNGMNLIGYPDPCVHSAACNRRRDDCTEEPSRDITRLVIDR